MNLTGSMSVQGRHCQFAWSNCGRRPCVGCRSSAEQDLVRPLWSVNTFERRSADGGCTLEPVFSEAISGRSDDGNWPAPGLRRSRPKLTSVGAAIDSNVGLLASSRTAGSGHQESFMAGGFYDLARKKTAGVRDAAGIGVVPWSRAGQWKPSGVAACPAALSPGSALNKVGWTRPGCRARSS